MQNLDVLVVDLAREQIITTIILAGPILLVGLLVGIGVSLFQALTSIQEQTMSFVPKMIAVLVVTLILLAPALQILSRYTQAVFRGMLDFGLR